MNAPANHNGPSGSGGGNSPNGPTGPGSGKRRNRKRRNRSNGKAIAEFWGDKASLPQPAGHIRITEDPAAVVRSLGRPPLPGQEQVSEAYFTAVYARAVGLASALAAAGDLIEPEELLD